MTEKAADLEGHSLPVFEISIRGRIHAPRDRYPVRHHVTVLDITSGPDDPLPVLCVIPDLQAPDSMAFAYTGPVTELPYADSVLPEWTEFLSIPIEALLFPEKGTRRLEFLFYLSGAPPVDKLAASTCTLSYDNPQLGYLDIEAAQGRADELAVMLAVRVSAVDGSLDKREGAVVKRWIHEKIASCPAEHTEKVRSRLNGSVKRALGMLKDGSGPGSKEICAELVEIAPLAKRYEILEFCLAVAKADSAAKAQELNIVWSLAEMLEVNRERFRVMSEKSLPVGIHEAPDEHQILGINSQMSSEQLRAHLRKEYKKWNALVTHSDPAIREQADQMLELIAKKRSELDG